MPGAKYSHRARSLPSLTAGGSAGSTHPRCTDCGACLTWASSMAAEVGAVCEWARSVIREWLYAKRDAQITWRYNNHA